MPTDTHANAAASELSVSLEIPYELRFLGLTLECMTGFFTTAGCTQNESAALCLALEETLVFLIHSYPDAETWERILMNCRLHADGVAEIVITNAGPPVHLDRVPQYDPEVPEESNVGGLWYFLAREAVDDLSFRNHGKDGWQVVIRKRLSEASFAEKSPSKGPAGVLDKKCTFTTRLAGPEDAAALVDLTYDTYRYSYIAEEFYYVSKLRQALEKENVVCIIVEADGALVGSSSLVFSKDTPRCGYSCSLMVKRAFRQSRAIIYLLKEVERYMANASGVDLYYAETATAHTGSQKAGAKTGFTPLALLLDVSPEVEFRGMKAPNSDRHALLLCVYWTSRPKLPVLYVPKRHQAVMAGLLTQNGYECSLSEEEATSVAEHFAFTVKEIRAEGCAFLVLSQIGNDFVAQMQKQLFELKNQGIQAVVVLVPAWCPLPPNLDREMAQINAFFTGIKPISTHESYLVYCTLSRTIDFDRIRIKDPLAENLKEHCRQLYQEIIG